MRIAAGRSMGPTGPLRCIAPIVTSTVLVIIFTALLKIIHKRGHFGRLFCVGLCPSLFTYVHRCSPDYEHHNPDCSIHLFAAINISKITLLVLALQSRWVTAVYGLVGSPQPMQRWIAPIISITITALKIMMTVIVAFSGQQGDIFNMMAE